MNKNCAVVALQTAFFPLCLHIKLYVCAFVWAHARSQTHSWIHDAAAFPVSLLVGERVSGPRSLDVTPALWDVAAPLETGRVPIIYMP